MHNCARYLIFFQYIGTKYSGVVRSPPHQQQKKGVQNHIEEAVRRLKPVNPVSLSVSSRTDSGVHALSNSAHLDIQRSNDKPPFTDDVLLEALNFHLLSEEIRVTRAQRVPADFHARYRAQSRTYVYRIALGTPHHSQLPLTDHSLCWGLRNTELNVKAMNEAASMLVGTHDFSSFRAVNSDMPFKSPVKTLDLAHIAPGNAFVQAHFHRALTRPVVRCIQSWMLKGAIDAVPNALSELFDFVSRIKDIQFWQLTFKSKSFLYKQVRRLTGALVAVGQGRLSVAQLRELLEARDTRAYPQGTVAPARGLFLTSVDYNQSDLQFPDDGEEKGLSPSVKTNPNPED